MSADQFTQQENRLLQAVADRGIEESEFDGFESDDEQVQDGTGAAPADALNINDPTWKFQEPKSQPLAYWVPTNASGGKAWKKIAFQVDFNSREDIKKAVKARRLSLWRAKKRHGLALARASTQGREYTAAATTFITNQHIAWAANHNNYQIPLSELVRRYNAHFTGENRTEASLATHIGRTPALQAMRGQFRHKWGSTAIHQLRRA